MLSTGNDIVSINAINVTRTKQPNFYSKILTPAETGLHKEPHFATIQFEIFVWLLWSIKESAFKFLQRVDAGILFTPVKFEVIEIQVPYDFKLLNFEGDKLTGIGFAGLNAIKSTIKFGDHILYSNSLIYQQFISSVVNDTEDFNSVNWGIKQIDSDEINVQSAEVRDFLIENLLDKNVTFSKNHQGVPVLLKDNMELVTPVSLSHHEYYIAYSFQLSV